MWAKPSDRELAALPKLYANEIVPAVDKMICGHFFTGGCDWFVAEYDPDDRLFFGFVILNKDYEMAEWGYFGLDELAEIAVQGIEVDWDKQWIPKKAKYVEKIVRGGGA